MKDKFKKLNIKFIGVMDWLKLRDFLILKLMECQSEKDLEHLIKTLLGSMFKNEKEIDHARKKAGIILLNDIERRKIRQMEEK